jgi:hypothetical protein
MTSGCPVDFQLRVSFGAPVAIRVGIRVGIKVGIRFGGRDRALVRGRRGRCGAAAPERAGQDEGGAGEAEGSGEPVHDQDVGGWGEGREQHRQVAGGGRGEPLPWVSSATPSTERPAAPRKARPGMVRPKADSASGETVESLVISLVAR